MRLEHINICVRDPKQVAAKLCDIFDWHIRWEGPSLDTGFTVHVGTDDDYIAFYEPGTALQDRVKRYAHVAGFNHVGVVVDDLDALEKKVRAAGYEPHSHYDYEPGHRFYFEGPGEIEYEVVSYA